MLKEAKKTESAVPGDPLPHLIRRFPEAFAGAAMRIFYKVNNTGYWPMSWKTEYLTIIPKVQNPAHLSKCRNISCTAAFSKILEGRLLQQLREELTPDANQYGGIPRCGVKHLLVDLWEEILGALEGGKDAAVLLGVDYEKAFNRMEHSVCLQELSDLGASAGSISLVRAFLEHRCMTVTLNGIKARRVAIQWGSPQGSVLGCFLYCATTLRLTSGREAAPQAGFFPQDSSDDEEVVFWEGAAQVTRPTKLFLYVDNTTLFQSAPLARAKRHLTTQATREELDNLELEPVFNRLEEDAEKIGMKINGKKTQLLVISPPNGCITTASLRTAEGEEIEYQSTLKLVGFTFGDTPGATSHVEGVRDKYRRKVWMLYHWRRSGLKGDQLFKLYCCQVRSVIEYCSAVYHSLLTKGDAEELERLHRNAV